MSIMIVNDYNNQSIRIDKKKNNITKFALI